jgi:hypothetical protein
MPSLICGANEVARERTAFLRGGDGAAAGRAGEEPRSVADTRGGAMSEPMLDAAGRRRSPATLPEHPWPCRPPPFELDAVLVWLQCAFSVGRHRPRATRQAEA